MEKFIVAFLLANIALAGALHFFPPVKPVAAVPETQPVNGPGVVIATARMAMTPVAFDFSAGSLDKFREWARADSYAALNWAMKQPASSRRTEMLEAACYQAAQNDPAQAVTQAVALNLTAHATLANLEQQWAQKDLIAARDWALALPADQQRDELLERVACVWAATDPVSAAQLALDKMTPGDAQVETVISVVHQWALRDMDGVKAWVLQFPEGDIRNRAMNELAGIAQYRSTLSAEASSQ